MPNLIDLTGQRLGRWLVISYLGDSKWTCRCDCGTEKSVDAYKLRGGFSKGCKGCAPNDGGKTHGATKTRLYKTWQKMRRRCLNPKADSYKWYGGRGITVCQEWQDSFVAFRDWALANGYEDHLTIDRKDNDGPYSPENCRWATQIEQVYNSRAVKPVIYKGRKVFLRDLAEEHGISYETLRSRYYAGWSLEEALSWPVFRHGYTRDKATLKEPDAA
jgi:hypothetical protein